MLAIVSPAKSLDFDTPAPDIKTQSPALLSESKKLVKAAQALSQEDIKSLMNVSDKIAALNHTRFANFTTPFTDENAKPALFAFTGDVYSGIDANTLNKEDIAYADEHLRILSGLYGVLRPTDLMQAYRLEMGRQFSPNEGESLYDFWNTKITNTLNEALDKAGGTLINLASQEYFKAVKPELINGEIIRVNFKENRGGQYKIISFSAKKARGLMARYMIDHRLDNPEALKSFDTEGYAFNAELSSDNEWIFTRDQPDS